MSDCEDPISRPHLAPVRDAFGHFSQINIKFSRDLDVDANEVDCSGDFLSIAGSVSLHVILSCPLTPPPSTFSLLLLLSLSHFPAVPSSVSICSCFLPLCSCHCRPLPLLCRSNYITAPVIRLRVMTWSSEQCFPPPIVKVEVGPSALGSDPRREPGVVGASPAPVVSVMTFFSNNLKGFVFLPAQVCRTRDGAVFFWLIFISPQFYSGSRLKLLEGIQNKNASRMTFLSFLIVQESTIDQIFGKLKTCNCPQGVWFGLFISRAVKKAEHVRFTFEANPEKKNADITSCCPGDD